MSVFSITTPSIFDANFAKPSWKIEEKPESEFSNVLEGAIDAIRDTEQTAKVSGENMVTGDVKDLHQMMIDSNKADVTLRLVLEVRNKVVEGYREIMQMQV